jgi:hypothetical protein
MAPLMHVAALPANIRLGCLSNLVLSSVLTFHQLLRLQHRRKDTTHNDIQHNGTEHNDTQHNDTQHNGTQHNSTQHNGTQHNGTQGNDAQHNDILHNNKWNATLGTVTLCIMAVLLCWVSFMLSVIYGVCHLCWVSFMQSRKQNHYAQCLSAECRYAECHYAKCHGAPTHEPAQIFLLLLRRITAKCRLVKC